MHGNHKDSRLKRSLAIYGQIFQSLHHLRLLHHHQLTVGEHRISSRRSDDCVRIHISSVAHCLIEVLLALVNAMLKYRIAHHINVIRFIAHQQIHRLEDAAAGIFHNLPAQRVRFYKSFCHNHTNIVRIIDFTRNDTGKSTHWRK